MLGNFQGLGISSEKYLGNPFKGSLQPLDIIAAPLAAAAELAAKAVRRKILDAKPKKKAASLRVGAETPLWNELAKACGPHLKTFGAKANLARELGISRQRVHLLLVECTAYPDAERALMLAGWLQRQKKPAVLPAQRKSPNELSSNR